LQFDYPNEMYILQQLYSTNSLRTACLGQVIIKIMQLKILLRVQWTPLVVGGLNKSLTTAYFKRSGKIPEDKDLLYIYGLKVS